MGRAKKAMIHYLFHSGFAVEYGDYFMIFDYYKLPNNTINAGITEKDLINKIKKYKYPFVFVSHSHYDHFNPVIFDWKKYNTSLIYIFSSDVRETGKEMDKYCGVDYFYMSAYNEMEKHGMKISTFGSTDIGVSFMVKVGELVIFHAGDLNWWHWAEESTQQELEEEERKFKEEVAGIQKDRIDIMFFPVDPRLGQDYWRGGTYMLEIFKPRLFVPMHFAENHHITRAFAERTTRSDVSIAIITHQGQSIEYSLPKNS